MPGAAISLLAGVGDHTTLEVRTPEEVHPEATGVLVHGEKTEVARSRVLEHILRSKCVDGVEAMAYYQFQWRNQIR